MKGARVRGCMCRSVSKRGVEGDRGGGGGGKEGGRGGEGERKGGR